jgi:hypothetical protein
MALPDDGPSSELVLADFIAPYDRYTGLLEDFEEGGIALNDGSQGMQVQMWYLSYDDDAESLTYGDFTVHAEETLQTEVVLNVPGVTKCSLAFNQNMDVFIAYETRGCEAKYYWYDPFSASYQTGTLPANSRHVACCYDDHRPTQTGSADIILGYIRSGTLYYRQLRDRFETEYPMGSVGAGILHKVGMTKNNRLLFDVRKGNGVRLSEIVGDLCAYVGVPGNRIDVAALFPYYVRGFKTAGLYTSADTIRSLQKSYFFDMPEIDGRLVAVMRGGPIVATISQNDCVAGREFDFETSREQGVEFPVKLHLSHASAETEYTPTKTTSERRSRDIKSQSEVTLETALNLTGEDAASIADRSHKIAWNEFEGAAKFSLPDSYAYLVPSNPISFEVRAGVYKRLRLVRMISVDGVYDCEAVIDRVSSYNLASAYGVATPVDPELPPPTIPGTTTWEFMDLPVLDGADTLHVYLAGHGDDGTAWHGAEVQRLVGADWEAFGDITTAELMGEVEATLPAASAYSIDTTNTVLVSLNGTPASTTFDLMMQGKGAWLIGDEIIQVQTWVAEGDNWRGSILLRGRLDTAPASHSIGTRAVFLGIPVLAPVDVALLDTNLTLRAPSYGEAGTDATEDDYAFTGRSQEEWPPEMLTAEQSGSDWVLSWIPRYRLGNSANPIPSAHFYGWQIVFTIGPDAFTKTTVSVTPEYVYTEADQIADFGSAQSSFDTVEVRALNWLGGAGKVLSQAVS